MKVFAIASVQASFTPEMRGKLMPREAPHTLQLYLDGVIEQFWFREGKGPIFLMNVASVEEAEAIVGKMPIVEAGVATYDFWPVGPLAPLGMLIAAH